MSRRKLIVGNWKMNGSLSANQILLNRIKAGLQTGIDATEVAVCVPALYISQCREELAGTSVAWGGQDVSAYESGAYTGEISSGMLIDFECKYVIVGHSECRLYRHENDDLIAKKVVRGIRTGLIPIVCVGESLAEREAGHTEVVVEQQLAAILNAIEPDELDKMVVAYEPVWAIGTGKTATPQMAQDIHGMLRLKLEAKNHESAAKVKILYGGSMKPDNANDLLAMPDIDGGLIGGASLHAEDFLEIIRLAECHSKMYSNKR